MQVRRERHIRIKLVVHHQLLAAIGSAGLPGGADTLQQVGDGDRLLFQPRPLILQARKIQHVAHQPVQPLGLLVQGVQVFLALLLLGDEAAGQHVEVQPQRGQGRAQLVRHRRDEADAALGQVDEREAAQADRPQGHQRRRPGQRQTDPQRGPAVHARRAQLRLLRPRHGGRRPCGRAFAGVEFHRQRVHGAFGVRRHLVAHRHEAGAGEQIRDLGGQ